MANKEPEEKNSSQDTGQPDPTQDIGSKPKRIPQNGVVKTSDIPLIADEFLKYIFPEESKQVNADAKYGQDNKRTGKKEVSGYRSQYIINALNEIIGPGNWREHGKMETEKPATAYVSTYYGILEIGNWHNDKRKKVSTSFNLDGSKTIVETEDIDSWFEVLARVEHVGGSRNMDKWESQKGAKTNFLKKAASYLSNGWKAYALTMDEDWNQSPAEPEKPLPPTRPAAPANAGQSPAAPATAAAKLISSVEHDLIVNNFMRLGYTPDQIPERLKVLEDKMGKPIEEFTQGEARDTIKKMEAQIAKKEETPPPPPEAPEPPETTDPE